MVNRKSPLVIQLPSLAYCVLIRILYIKKHVYVFLMKVMAYYTASHHDFFNLMCFRTYFISFLIEFPPALLTISMIFYHMNTSWFVKPVSHWQTHMLFPVFFHYWQCSKEYLCTHEVELLSESKSIWILNYGTLC